jgi:hypothetical protein
MWCRDENKLQHNPIPPHFLSKDREKELPDLDLVLFLSCVDLFLLIQKGKISAKVKLSFAKSEIVGDS